jgi:hypothetical protein
VSGDAYLGRARGDEVNGIPRIAAPEALSQFLTADRKIEAQFVLAYAASRSNCSASDGC